MKKTIMAVAALLPLCAGLMAQNLDDSEIYSVKDGQLTSALDSIVVSASRVDAKSPVAYSEMDKEALRLQSPASSLPMMLSLQPSVVTTNEGGIPDVVQDGVNGIICERQNAESLADAIERLLLNPELRIQMGNAGYEIFRQKFTLEKFERRMCECLGTCV